MLPDEGVYVSIRRYLVTIGIIALSTHRKNSANYI